MRPAQERPLRRRLDAATTTTTSRPRSRPTTNTPTPAASMVPRERQREMHRLGLLLRRHACHARRPSPSRALLQGPARGRAPRRARSCARASRPSAPEKTATGWRVLTAKGPIECREGRGRDQRLYRRSDAAAEAPRRAGGEPHHRHRGLCPSLPTDADPRHARGRRHQAGADLLPALARRQAADLRRPRALHRGAAGGERAGALPAT